MKTTKKGNRSRKQTMFSFNSWLISCLLNINFLLADNENVIKLLISLFFIGIERVITVFIKGGNTCWAFIVNLSLELLCYYNPPTFSSSSCKLSWYEDERLGHPP